MTGSPYREILIEGQVLKWWNCITPDCENAVCTWASEALCFPCMAKEVGHDEMERRYNDTHERTWAEVWAEEEEDDDEE